MRYKLKRGKKYLDVLVLAIIISVSIILVAGMKPAITGHFASAGAEWESRSIVEATNSEHSVATHVVFGNYKPQNCADGIYVETADGQMISFRTENEIISEGACLEADVAFSNIGYPQQEQQITYLVYYGKIVEQATEEQQPAEEIILAEEVQQKPAMSFGTQSFGAAVTFGAKATEVGGCTNITSSGVYSLTSNVTNSNDLVCISINASHVRLDCQGWNVDGTDTSSTFGINVTNAVNVTLAGCNVTDWRTGIYFQSTNTSYILNTSANTNTVGINITGVSQGNIITNTTTNSNTQGVTVYGNNNIIRNSTANSNSIGFESDGTNNTFDLDTAVSNTNEGFEVAAAPSNVVANSTARNSRVGIDAGNTASGSTIEYNLVVGNSRQGIDFGTGGNAIARHNIIRDNADGIRVASSTSNQIINNTFTNNTNATQLIGGTSKTRIINNTMSGGKHGIAITPQAGSAPSKNYAFGNNISNASFAGIFLSGSDVTHNYFQDDAFFNNTWDFYYGSVGNNNTGVNETIGGTVVSFFMVDAAIRNATAPAADPTGFANITRWLNITNTSSSSPFVFINMTYADSDLGALLDGGLIVAKYNGTTWLTNQSVYASSFGVDTAKNVVYANITDFNGTDGALSFAPMVDTAPPSSIDYVAPTDANATLYARQFIIINITATDTALANITVKVFNATSLVNETVSTSSPYFINVTLPRDGNYTFNATATDTAGNTNSTASRIVAIDTTSPVTNYVSPTEVNNANLSRRFILINVTSTDTHLKNITIYVFNATSLINETTTTSGPNFVNITVPRDGNYTFNATATDEGTNTNSTVSRTVRVDTLQPAIQFISPTPANNAAVSGTQNISVNASDTNFVNITIYNETSQAQVCTSAPCTFVWDTTKYSDGNHTFNASAPDAAGNINWTETRTFVVNNAVAKAAAAVTSSGAGGGAGGTGAIGESSSSVVIGDIGAGERKAVFFAGGTRIEKVAFEASQPIAGAIMTAGDLLALPLEISKAPDGLAYKYIRIQLPGVESAVANREITFKVEKNWIVKNNINESAIALLRYYSSSWQGLLIRQISEDGTNVYYVAETPGFGVFAIVGEKKPAVVVPAAVTEAHKENEVVETTKTSTLLFQLPKLNFEPPKFIVNFSKKVAFLLTPNVLIIAALLATIVIVLARFAPKFLKDRAVRKAIEARKPKILRLAHDTAHYRQAREAGDVAQGLSKDISDLERALKKLK